MHLARFAGFEHEADARARAFADQVVMQAGDGQQRRDGGVVLVHAAIGEDDDVLAGGDRAIGLGADVVHAPFRGPSAPSFGLKRIGMVTDLNSPSATCFSFASSSLVRIGDFSSMRWQLSGSGLSRLRSEPMVVSDEVMISSRMQSIGGLVTCAKSCLK